MSLESPSCPGTCCGGAGRGGWFWDTAVRALPLPGGWALAAPWRLASLPPSPMIWKCRKWDYPGTDVHKGGEMESVTVAPAFDYL